MVITLAQALYSLGHCVVILNIRGVTEHLVPENLVVVDGNFDMSARKAQRHYEKFSRLFARLELNYGKFDLILSNLSLSHSLFRRLERRVYFVVHNTTSLEVKTKKGVVKKFRYKHRLKKFYKNKSSICVSDGVRQDLIQNFEVPQNLCRTIYNPFNFKMIREQADQNPELCLPTEYIINVGRLSRQKRQDILIEAFARSEISGSLVIVGKGEMDEELKSQACRLGVQDRVVFIGFIKNPYPVIKNARCMVLSSDFEGLPTVLIESLICSVPIISTDCPSGPREIMLGPLSEFLCPMRDPDALSKKIWKMWNDPPNLDYADLVSCYEMKYIAERYLELE